MLCIVQHTEHTGTSERTGYERPRAGTGGDPLRPVAATRAPALRLSDLDWEIRDRLAALEDLLPEERSVPWEAVR